MHPKELDKLLQDVAAGRTTCEAARDAISGRGHEGLNLDQWRFERTDVGEVVYGQGKTLEQIAASLEGLGRHHPVLATRIERDHGRELLRRFPDGCLWEDARLFSLGADLLAPDPKAPDSDVLIVTAGSSDLAVAREALGTARFLSLSANMVCDVGVAGLHRLEPHLESLRLARVVIAVAGMEGAPAERAGRAGQSAHRCWSRPPRAMEPTSPAWPPCWPCSTPARRAWAWSISTTGSERRCWRRKSWAKTV